MGLFLCQPQSSEIVPGFVADSAEATGLKWATPAGGGKVLQVVQGTTTTAMTTTSTSLQDTNLSATITPSANTSKVLIMTMQRIATSRSSAYFSQIKGALLRASTIIVDYSAGSSGGQYITFIEGQGVSSGAHKALINFCYLDSPSTTSSTTYKTQMCLDSSSLSASFTAQEASTISTMILMEIGA